MNVGSFVGKAVKVGVMDGAKVDEGSSVGEFSDVLLGTSVCVGVSVGGIMVLVGRAACVSAIAVKAPAMDVLCTSSSVMGACVATGAPQELASRASTIMILIFKFIPGKIPYLMTILSLKMVITGSSI